MKHINAVLLDNGVARVGRRYWVRLAVLGAVALAAVLFTWEESGARASAAASTPKSGGTIVAAMPAVSNNLDPAKIIEDAQTDGPDSSAVYGELDYENSKTGAIEMGFLKSITGSNGYKTWTLTLRPGLKFSDGTPFNAAAIQYNYDRDAEPNTASVYQPIASTFQMQVLGATELKITVPTPEADFPAIIAESLSAIGSPTAIKAEGSGFGLKPVGAGPFEVTSFTPGQTITMVRNPYYKLFAPGQPYLNGITFTYVPNAPQEATAIQENEAQFTETLGTTDLKTLQSAGAVATVTVPGGGESLWLNNAIPPFNNLLAREAFSLAVNRAAIASGQLPGTRPINNLFQKSSPFYNPKYNFPAQNPAKAQQLFNQLAQEGHPFNLTFTTVPTARGQALGATIQSELAAYKNTSVTIDTVPLSSWSTDERAGNYEAIIEDMYTVTPMPEWYNTFATNASLNTFKWSDPIVTNALTAIQATNNVNTQKKLYGEVEQQILKDDPVYFAAQGVTGIETTKDITGIQPIDAGELLLWGQVGYAK